MPIYDYRCTACDQEVEVVHGIHEGGPERCERCGGSMRKALTAPAIHFKGSGWAKKDAQSAATAAKKPSTKTAADEAKSKATADGKGESGSSGQSPSDSGGGKPGDAKGADGSSSAATATSSTSSAGSDSD